MAFLTPIWSLGVAAAVFAVATAAIVLAGVRLSTVVDRLADRTGLGEALAGAVLLGAATSLSGLTVTVVAAAGGDASLAVSNAVGGIAAQTTFLIAADLALRGANLEHAAASVGNLFQVLVLVVLLALVLAGAATPGASIIGVHPVSPLLAIVYVAGLRLGRAADESGMWQPRRTPETVEDVPQEESERYSLAGLWAWFAGLALVLTVAGWAIGRGGMSIIEQTGMSATVVGAFFTSISTSLPELVTAVAAVRAGAPTLAVAGIIGGNTFDVLFVSAADAVYGDGTVLAAIGPDDRFTLAWTLILVGIAGAGLVRREVKGIGFEGFAMFATYVGGLVVLAV